MGLKIETWNIAYRKKKDGFLSSLDDFIVINNGHKGWYADPFLYEHDGKTYLFAEFFSYTLNRGVIVCAEYSEELNKFGEFQDIIREDYHLSYPVVFEFDGRILMMPESGQSNALYMYEAISFPYLWRKLPVVMDNVKLVDTTPIVIDNKLYALSLKQGEGADGELILLEYNGGKFNKSHLGVLTSDMSIARPGGHFICYNNKLYRVSQNCSKGYGYSLNVLELPNDFVNNYSEQLVKEIFPDEIKLLNAGKPDGIHTYNSTSQLEVVDLKYYRNSYYRVLLKVLHK